MSNNTSSLDDFLNQSLLDLENSWNEATKDVEGLLDSFYVKCVNLKDYIKGLKNWVVSTNTKERMLEVLQSCSLYRLRALECFYSTANSKLVLGCQSDNNFSIPSLIVVLGCKDKKTQLKRVQGLVRWLCINSMDLSRSFEASVIDSSLNLDSFKSDGKKEKLTIVFSGAGYSAQDTEAAQMKSIFMQEIMSVAYSGSSEEEITQKDIEDSFHFVLEEFSLDTVGNAVFVRLLLEEMNIPSNRSLLVITSTFHALRSLKLFQKVFGKECVSVLPVNTTGVHMMEELSKSLSADASVAASPSLSLAEKELQGEARSLKEIFSLNSTFPIHEGDVTSILYQLLTQHGLYKFRYDLLRRFSPLLENK